MPVETAAVSDHEGQRLVTHTVQHDYVTQNGRIVRETVTTDGTVTAVMDFIYDESGRPFALNYSTDGSSFTTYYYLLNLQGDVVALIDDERNTVASYTYSAWGNILSTTGELAEANPLRYRGYYYDTETGFYYLQSRYYDPVNHRFINADGYASTGQGFIGTNMFAYCNDSPITFADPFGSAPVFQRSFHAMYTRDDVPPASAINKVFYFYTADQAATMAGIIANEMSAETKLEYICGIYEGTALDGTNYYYYGELIEGYYSFADQTKVKEESKNMPGVLVAYMHSHPYCVCHDCNIFSGLDSTPHTGDARVVEKDNIPLYLAAPNGTLQLLTTELTVVLISTNLPTDQTYFECP